MDSIRRNIWSLLLIWGRRQNSFNKLTKSTYVEHQTICIHLNNEIHRSHDPSVQNAITKAEKCHSFTNMIRVMYLSSIITIIVYTICKRLAFSDTRFTGNAIVLYNILRSHITNSIIFSIYRNISHVNRFYTSNVVFFPFFCLFFFFFAIACRVLCIICIIFNYYLEILKNSESSKKLTN